MQSLTGVSARWPTRQQELQDEVEDMQILNAVQQSMYEYEKTHRHHRHKRAEKSVCYDELGCFEDSGPFGYLDMLPQSPEEIGTKFFFYSTENRSDKPLLEIPYLNMSRMFDELSHDKDNTTESKFPSNTTDLTPELMKNMIMLKAFEGFDRMSVRVIVHGFGAACHHIWIYEMRTALMAVVSNPVHLSFIIQHYSSLFLIHLNVRFQAQLTKSIYCNLIAGRLHCHLR